MTRYNAGSGLDSGISPVVTMPNNAVTATAHSNIALVKYWGKSPGEGNLPAVGSLSIGLDALSTTTRLRAIEADHDVVRFDGEEAQSSHVDRIVRFLDRIRTRFSVETCFEVDTANNFPTGAGLASSASGFAALTLAADALLELELTPVQLSQLARTGSGSAARSIYGGFVEIQPGEDPAAYQIADAPHWPLDVVVAITSEAEKPVGSTEAMQRTASTSPYYQAWCDSHDEDMKAAKAAVEQRDFERLADVAEASCLKMHATMMTSSPPVLFWLGDTMNIMHEVQRLRRDGCPAFFTIDAGPQVKVITTPSSRPIVEEALSAMPGVIRTMSSHVGGTPSVRFD